MVILTWSAFFLLVFLTWINVEAIRGSRLLLNLGEIDESSSGKAPLVSVIIPALNEEHNIEAALASVLALDYAQLEFIVLDDRSTDATGSILDHMAAQDARLQVVHIQELPPGWLGKNHALHCGVTRARGEFLLFSDADVYMKPDTLSRAVTRMLTRQLDHLCLIFRPLVPGSLLEMLVVDTLSGLISILKPWRTIDPNSPYFFGIGAFNLVRTATYHSLGGHYPIRLCPVDDILLGRLIKEGGGRQECLNGRDFISVPWYGSISEMVHGLQKNIFAAVDYRLDRLVLATILIICCHILPFWGMLFSTGCSRFFCTLIVVVVMLSHLAAAKTLGVSLSSIRWFPVTPYLKIFIMWMAVGATLFQGGIVWRGTFYPLDELRQHMVPLWPWAKENNK